MSDASRELSPSIETSAAVPTLTSTGRLIILIAAFLGWFCAGWMMSITSVAMEPAVVDLLDKNGVLSRTEYNALNKRAQAKDAAPLDAAEKSTRDAGRATIAKWFGFGQCAFLFGAAAGGLIFGSLGDTLGRARGMAVSILTYSLGAGAATFAPNPQTLVAVWFVACLGVGGMWPNGVALVSEAWSGMSRPMVAGLIGTAANIGILLLSTLAAQYKAVTSDNWHWIFYLAAAPTVLGIFSLVAVPESPRWLASRQTAEVQRSAPRSSVLEIFTPPLLWTTLIAILLATVAINGGWGSANWMVPWAADVGKTMDPPNPFLKAQVSQYRSLTGCVSSLLGGWIASVVGRRRTYFLTSLLILLASQYAFWFVTPRDQSFLMWVALIGFFSGIYFGFLPLFLPELFPTRVRSTGAGVGFNFGRILTAVSVLTTAMLTEFFRGDYARIGRVTSLAFAVGMVVILFAPDTSRRKLDD